MQHGDTLCFMVVRSLVWITDTRNGRLDVVHMAKRNSVVRTPRTSPRNAVVPTVPVTLDDAVGIARTVNASNIDAVVDAANRDTIARNAPGKNVCRFDNASRIMAFQNMTFVRNATWQLDDVQLIALWRMAFPGAVGRVFARSVRDTVGMINGIRADYNRNGHSDPAWIRGTTPASVRYGAKRFDFGPAIVAPTPVAEPVAPTRTRKPVAPKPAGRLVKRRAA